MSRKTYTSSDVDVSFDAGRCIHAAECVKRLPAVFDTKKRPWIQPDQASADEITAVVERCPSGALQYQRHDKTEPEQPDPVNTITLQADGPLYVRGDLSLELNGETQTETRLALCRCGQSQNKPYCDNTHKESGFHASGQLPTSAEEVNTAVANTPLTIRFSENGPILLKGSFQVRHPETDEPSYQSEKAALCRCGGSMNKPFCDGTHRTIGFSGAS